MATEPCLSAGFCILGSEQPLLMQPSILKIILPWLCTVSLVIASNNSIAEEHSTHLSLTLPSGEEIAAEVFGYQDNEKNILRILWIAPSFGIHKRHRQIAERLSQQKINHQNIEVWLVDLADALFLTRSAQSLRGIPGKLVADLIISLSQNHRHETLIISSRYGAIPAIRGIHAWQTRRPEHKSLIGAILFSPSFFTHVPQLGVTPSFIPELKAMTAPIHIFQAGKNSARWHLPTVLEQLQNTPVSTEILNGVISLYYDKDTAPETLRALENAPGKIKRAINKLRQHEIPLNARPITATMAATRSSGLDTKLKPYQGSVKPTPFSLNDTNGKLFNVGNFKGQVTLVNFWASWCAPCIKEIPSLNRLKQKMQGKPFRLISVNYAESPKRIREFMKEVDVDFPILLDLDGQIAGQWKVVAFPSTFVIGPNGEIHAGVNAAIHWDTENVIGQLNQLIEQTQQ